MEQKKRGRPKKKVVKKGLGDQIENVLAKTGVKGLVEFVNGGKCSACEKRKVFLNKLFPEIVYNLEKGKATPEQKEVLKKIGLNKDSYNSEEAQILEAIYNQAYHTNVRFCRTCSNKSQNRTMIIRLKKLI